MINITKQDIINELEEIGVKSKLIDLVAINLLVEEINIYNKALYNLEQEGYILLHTNKIGAENTKKNEWYSIQQNALNNILKILPKLNLGLRERLELTLLKEMEKETETNLIY